VQNLQLEEALNQVKHKFEKGTKKRFACSHCGKTWAEIIGSFSFKIDGQQDVFFKFGDESEACHSCEFRSRTCPACGSKDAYEINFPPDAQETPLSFNQIRIVDRYL